MGKAEKGGQMTPKEREQKQVEKLLADLKRRLSETEYKNIERQVLEHE